MRIGFISYESPFDRSSFSGTLFYMYSALSAQKAHTITAIGHSTTPGFLEQKLYPKALRFCLSYLPAFAKQLATFNKKQYIKHVQNAIDSNKYDLFVAPVSSDIIAALKLTDSAIKRQNNHSQKPHKRIIFITDATPGYIAEEYQLSSNPKAHITEESCLKKSYKCLYSSHFMADMALDEFNKTPNIKQKIAVVRFGLNLDNPPKTKTTKGPLNHFNLVFVGKVTDPNQYDTLLLETITAALAADIAYPLSGSISLASQLTTLYRDKLKEARFVDATEGNTVNTASIQDSEVLAANTFINARL